MTCCMLVAPFVGAWIEIDNTIHVNVGLTQVAPFVGAWIEIVMSASVKDTD